MKVTYLDHMGTDLSVVNAARVSFAKESEWEVFEPFDCMNWPNCDEVGCHEPEEYELSEKDTKLIAYLAKHNHWTPFAHTAISLHLKLPFFVAAQVKKHQVGFVVNEVSRRYVDSEPEFYMPEKWRKRAVNVKQGSSEETVEYPFDVSVSVYNVLLREYKSLLEHGVCPEQARMVLPLSTYTEFWMTGSLAAWARMYKQRSHSVSC